MAGTHYSVGLVDADYASKAQSMVYLIPTEDNTDVTIRAIYEGSEDQFNVQSLQVREGSKLYMFGVRKKTTLFVDSSKPILLSVGVQSVEYGEHSVDYGSFMPTPLPNLSKAGPSDCGVSSEDDTLRFADLQGQWNFMITPYNPSCESFNVMLHTSNGNTQIKEVNTSSLQYPIGLDDKASHHYVGIKQPIGSSVHVASLCRYATTGIFDNGFFLDNVPTISQWVTGTVMFTTMLEKESVVAHR
ncbi:hypothetical protein AB6A40_008061 [Gnathostoma spinigerum]|uniref:IgGFc-binding protein N-terminal domain-containing protein n=1 Tax=Gnathostoma spinigerum TaxID=75299 RepID=A0ABD6EXN2_9BILA